MARYSAVRSSLWWLVSNALVGTLRLRRLPRTRIRYEDLVTDPVAATGSALDRLGVAVDSPLEVSPDNVVELSTSHSVAGNPMRFVSGPVRLRLDDEWRTAMRPAPRLVVHLLTWPLARRYRRSESRP
jgi:hypothetical protein